MVYWGSFLMYINTNLQFHNALKSNIFYKEKLKYFIIENTKSTKFRSLIINCKYWDILLLVVKNRPLCPSPQCSGCWEKPLKTIPSFAFLYSQVKSVGLPFCLILAWFHSNINRNWINCRYYPWYEGTVGQQ